MADFDESERPGPEFKPGWPDFFPHGLIVARTTVTQRDDGAGAEDLDLDESGDDELSWGIYIGLRDEEPRHALLGDLTVTSPWAFGGVTVIMPFSLRDEPSEPDTETLDGLLEQYGEWASPVMYDHAATVLRSALAGSGLALFVPFATPDAAIRTSAIASGRAADSTSDS